jgi:DNA-binding CsgD family transcriptional regulator
MTRISVVIDYGPADVVPSFAANTRALGGKVIAVAFGDRLLEPESVGDETDKALAGLSQRERQVLELRADGMSTEQIAQAIGISRRTVNSYRYRIHEQLGVSNDYQALALFFNSRKK